MKVFEREHLGGIQKVYRFDNGYGASVIKNPYSYGGDKGLWELAVLRFDGDNYSIAYDTSLTNDVIGHLTWAEVEILLDKIKAL